MLESGGYDSLRARLILPETVAVAGLSGGWPVALGRDIGDGGAEAAIGELAWAKEGMEKRAARDSESEEAH